MAGKKYSKILLMVYGITRKYWIYHSWPSATRDIFQYFLTAMHDSYNRLILLNQKIFSILEQCLNSSLVRETKNIGYNLCFSTRYMKLVIMCTTYKEFFSCIFINKILNFFFPFVFFFHLNSSEHVISGYGYKYPCLM